MPMDTPDFGRAHERWLDPEDAETDEEYRAILERIQGDADRRYDEMRDRELEAPRDE